KDFAFAGATTPVLPRHNRSTLGIAVIVHVVLLALLIHIRTKPVRVSSAGSPYAGIAAYVPGPIAAVLAAATPKPAEPKKTALKTEVAKNAPKEDQSDAATAVGSAGVVGASQPGAGPVRFGSGGNLTLIKKVTPIYPPMMQSARMTGQVVLDAIIHPDGTIGDITVLRS